MKHELMKSRSCDDQQDGVDPRGGCLRSAPDVFERCSPGVEDEGGVWVWVWGREWEEAPSVLEVVRWDGGAIDERTGFPSLSKSNSSGGSHIAAL